MINDIGRVCIKIAGRDAGLRCAIIDVLDNNNVLIDGETRRRKCNIMHLEPTEQMISIEKGASHEEVAAAFKELGVEIKAATKAKEKKEKPSKKRISTKAAEEAKAKPKKEAKAKKAAEKKKK